MNHHQTMAIQTRIDGRNAHQIRAISLEEGFLNRADGSARLCQGNTNVMGGVFGPAASRSFKPGQHSEFLDIDVILGPQCGVPSEKLSSYKTFILDVLLATIRIDQYPRCGLEVTLRCLHNDGSLLANLVNVAISAVMDAGVEMMTFPVASCFSYSPNIVQEDGVSMNDDGVVAERGIMADPNSSEEKNASALVTIVCTAEKNQILAVEALGIMEGNTVSQCCDAAVSVAKSFAEIARQKLGS